MYSKAWTKKNYSDLYDEILGFLISYHELQHQHIIQPQHHITVELYKTQLYYIEIQLNSISEIF